MFVVTSLKNGQCLCCEKETECVQCECQQRTLKGLLCPKCLVRQIRMRMQCQADSDRSERGRTSGPEHQA